MKKIIGQQGEVRIVKLDALPAGKTASVAATEKGFVIAHSESGHHHLLTGGDVMERIEDVPAGMRILYAVVENAEKLIQDAAHPHDGFDLEPGFYEFRISREYDPFAEQARQVAD